ncbi:hypothetical protein [Intestinimonas sp.]|uniref:hypothetical protein n=1 Tax=Intestinimonas sp. TaxID=1965293 RepID=UPI00261BBA1B|nr:hypothetical protein [Intestinimonas sp.]
MLDDLMKLAAGLGDAATELFKDGDRGRKPGAVRPPATKPARPSRTAGKAAARAVPRDHTVGRTTARREKRGEDPWDWKEEKPSWEG